MLGLVTDGAAIRLRGRPDKTAQNDVSGGDREAGGYAEEPGSRREVGNMAGDGRRVPSVSFLLSITFLNHPGSFEAPPLKVVTCPAFPT